MKLLLLVILILSKSKNDSNCEKLLLKGFLCSENCFELY